MIDSDLTFGVWLRRQRRACDLTQAELAARVGCSVSALRKFEADELRPSRPLATSLAGALAIAPQDRDAFVRFARDMRGDALVLLPGQPVSPQHPAPRSTVPPALPVPPTALIGREHECAALCHLLRQVDTRLVTVTGPGGIGKTRLSLQVVAELMNTFPDGVYFVDLAPIREPEQIVLAVAHTLGVVDAPGRPVRDRVRSWLAERQVLLLLDNCEQVVAGVAALVAEFVRCAAGLTVLATSRLPLRIAAEQEYLVVPLALPAPHTVPALDQLSQYAAVALFVARARAVRADFTLTAGNAPAVAAICTRLDGLPLAIELAAARVRVFSADQLLRRLASAHLSILSGGARDLPARQRTMRATIDWSYRLLAPEQQQLLAQLGVFVGGWTFAAAEAIGGVGEHAVLEGLDVLLQHGLVRRLEREHEPRYIMLETIREYALEQLDVSSSLAAARRRHAAYVLALAETAHAQLPGRDHGVWLDRLEREHDNLRVALRWALEGGDRAIGAGIAIALAGQDWDGLWSRMGYWGEGWRWLAAVLTQRDALAPRLHAWVLLLTAVYRGMLDGNPFVAQHAVLDEALALFRTAGDRSGIAYVLRHQGAYDARNNGVASRVEESLALYQEVGDHYHHTTVLHQLGCIARDNGAILQGVARLEQSLALGRERGYIRETSTILNDLGDAACIQGNLARATTYYWEALQLILDERDYAGVPPLLNLGWLALVQGDDGRVLARMQHFIGWFRKQDVLSNLIHMNHVLGALVNAHGDSAQALVILRDGLILQQQFQEQDVMIQSLEAFAGVAVRQGQAVRAAHLLAVAETQYTTIGCRRLPAMRPAFERDVASARAQLGDTAFAAAWAAGLALTLEQAIAEALAA